MTKQTHAPEHRLQRALLICNGEHPTRALAKRLARQARIIIAADGGANIARELGVTPDLIIGDLDSITPSTKRFFSSTPTIRIPRQDNTDMEKALDYIVAASLAREVMIIGATGKRIDHTVGNLAVLSNYARRVKVIACGDGWHAFPAKGIVRVHASVGTTLSLLPFSACHGITLRGLKFPLRNASLRAGQVAVSNEVRRSPCTITVRQGTMLIVVLEEFIPQ